LSIITSQTGDPLAETPRPTSRSLPTTPAGLSSDPGTRSSELPYLAGLDGLRALSVVAVILFHAQVAGFDGGFFGVEVFFVISGYLITSLLLAERERTGSVSLRRFWMRRARRLLPALATLLVATIAIAAIFAPDAVVQTRGDVPAALFFVSNWWQVARNHSYFMAIERPPLLLHLWSLAVEEQFYMVVPPTLVFVGFVCGKIPRRWLAIVAASTALASACWMAALFDPSVDPSGIYMRTDTRLSGLLLGVALAAIVPAASFSRGVASTKPRLWLDALGLAGIAAVCWAFTRWNDTDPFVYRFGFLAVDVASMAMIASAVGPSRVGRLLGARPLKWLGLRSYGLYLWHWPVMAVTRPDFDTSWSGGPLLTLRIALTVGAAELSYRFVEVPARRGALSAAVRSLVGRGSPVERVRAWRVVVAMTVVAGLAVAGLRVAPVRADGPHAAEPDGHVAHVAHVAHGVAEPQAGPQNTAGQAAFSGPPAPDAPAPAGTGLPIDPAWPKTLTLLTDSVTLGVRTTLPAAMPDWNVEVVGRPALMVKQVVPEFLKNKPHVGSVVVIGVAYNSLFEKNRRNFDRWAAIWDREAERLLSDLRARGAKKFVWVTLREPTPDVVTERGKSQYELYAWFFPYVNERLHALVQRHPEITLADWSAVSDKPGLTYDLIHLSPAGAKLMTRTITDAVLGPP
jgi:peptidoglycan/LPS O-acetylase OafA/YrhL